MYPKAHGLSPFHSHVHRTSSMHQSDFILLPPSLCPLVFLTRRQPNGPAISLPFRCHLLSYPPPGHADPKCSQSQLLHSTPTHPFVLTQPLCWGRWASALVWVPQSLVTGLPASSSHPLSLSLHTVLRIIILAHKLNLSMSLIKIQ